MKHRNSLKSNKVKSKHNKQVQQQKSANEAFFVKTSSTKFDPSSIKFSPKFDSIQGLIYCSLGLTLMIYMARAQILNSGDSVISINKNSINNVTEIKNNTTVTSIADQHYTNFKTTNTEPTIILPIPIFQPIEKQVQTKLIFATNPPTYFIDKKIEESIIDEFFKNPHAKYYDIGDVRYLSVKYIEQEKLAINHRSYNAKQLIDEYYKLLSLITNINDFKFIDSPVIVDSNNELVLINEFTDYFDSVCDEIFLELKKNIPSKHYGNNAIQFMHDDLPRHAKILAMYYMSLQSNDITYKDFAQQLISFNTRYNSDFDNGLKNLAEFVINNLDTKEPVLTEIYSFFCSFDSHTAKFNSLPFMSLAINLNKNINLRDDCTPFDEACLTGKISEEV